MLHGDISSDTPPRVLVHISVLFNDEIEITKKMFGLINIPRTSFTPSMKDIAFFHRWSDRGLLMELFHYSNDGYPADAMYELLDDISHPFSKLLQFRNVRNLAEYLAYQSDIKHVVDPFNPMAFGSRSLGDI